MVQQDKNQPKKRRTSAKVSGRRSASSQSQKAKRSSQATTQKNSRSRNSSKSRSLSKTKSQTTFGSWLVNSIGFKIFVGVFVAAICLWCVDTVAYWGKAYSNVVVEGIPVGGMSASEIEDTLKSELGMRISHTQVTLYESENDLNKATQKKTDTQEPLEVNNNLDMADNAEATLSDEGGSEEGGTDGFEGGVWQVDTLSLKAKPAYAQAAEDAIKVGREDGGLLKRLSLLFKAHTVELSILFKSSAFEKLASKIDTAIGNPRVDAQVIVEDGLAVAIEGHDGSLVDRDWLQYTLSRAFVRSEESQAFVIQTAEAYSRISYQDALDFAAVLNEKLVSMPTISFKDRQCSIDNFILGNWTYVSIAGEEGNYYLSAALDQSLAIPLLVDLLDARIDPKEITVNFEKNADGLMVHTSGTGNIPEVGACVTQLEKELFGENGRLDTSDTNEIALTIEESNRPESASFEDALNLGIISEIGTFTTEFTNYEGTENRNHNIKFAADVLDNSVVGAHGGVWSFNDLTGNTNEDAGYWTAGSIVEGEYVDSVGGGICQVATTIFNAVLEAGLDINERHNHTLFIASYPEGRDAAVNYPDMDLVWSNRLESDVLLKLSYTDTSLTASLYSVHTDYVSEYKVGDWKRGEKYKTVFEDNENLDPDTYYKKTDGEDGSEITVTRTVKDADGQTVLTDTFTSSYEPKNEVYVVGKNVDTSQLGTRKEKNKNRT